jgi:hypothetical protein
MIYLDHGAATPSSSARNPRAYDALPHDVMGQCFSPYISPSRLKGAIEGGEGHQVREADADYKPLFSLWILLSLLKII